MLRGPSVVFVVLVTTLACGDNSGDPGPTLQFDLEGATGEAKTFFNAPFPSDLRLHPDGRPDLTGYPNPRSNPIVAGLREIADQRRGFPMMPVAYFRFDAELAPASLDVVNLAEVGSNILFINVDQASSGLGELLPTVAQTLVPEEWAPQYLLAVAPRPGFVLRGDTTYAVVVKRAYGDLAGEPLGVADVIADLAAGIDPGGALGARALELFSPLWLTLDSLGIPRGDVAAATVFTTGDEVATLGELTNRMLARDSVSLTSALVVDPDDGADHARFCELVATVEYAQYQTGTPPFNEGGLFEIGPDGLPVIQRVEAAPIVIAIPKIEMPAAGFPLMLYFHGSGGRAASVIDAGPATVIGGPLAAGLGPAHVVAEHGIASAGSALPLSPDRFFGANDISYLNLNNLAAFRDTFRQGVIEQRLFLRELLTLRIAPAALAGCAGPTLAAGQTEFFFDPASVVASGQSMGGMYTNLVSPLEPLIRASVPTGAGGMWNKMILETELIEGVGDFIGVIIGTSSPENSFVHPGMHMLALAWEAAEPVAFMPRLARDPLPGMPTRPTYEPTGDMDIYFPTSIYDAAVTSYGHQQAGDEVWPEMQEVLTLAGLGGLVSYPVTGNLTSESGESYTGVAVQYAPDGIRDGHFIYAQLDEVKYQYGCFFASFLATGTATVPAPAPLGTPCPGVF